MPDNTTTVWYGKLRLWDPALPEHRCDSRDGLVMFAGDAAYPTTTPAKTRLSMILRSYAKKLWIVATFGSFPFRLAAAIEGHVREMTRRTGDGINLREKIPMMLHDWCRVQQSRVFWKAVDKKSIVGRL